MAYIKDKWDKAYKLADFSSADVALVLKQNSYLLPNTIKQSFEALDLACGRAGNAQYLVKKGFHVDAIDISSVLIEGLQAFVAEKNLSINPILRDIETDGLGEKKYDVIVVSYFLNRELFPQIVSALKPNGLLFYQTWSQLKVSDVGPNNPNYRLQENELLNLCDGLKFVYYREDGLEGDQAEGLRNEAMIVAKLSSD